MDEGPERTPDGRYVVIDGRLKGTPEERRARAGVQAAKVALGERGTPWWEQSDDERRRRWSAEVPEPSHRP